MSRDYCEACGYTDSHDPNCPRPKEAHMSQDKPVLGTASGSPVERKKMKLGDRLWHKRHDDFAAFDRITLEIIPRYKTSGLSGDEWRQHVEVKFWFKGHEVHSFGSHDMEGAILLLGSEWLRQQSPIPNAVIKLEEDTCDQPSCVERPVARYVLKELFSRSGEKLDLADKHGATYYRKFCAKHGTRGDCGREDSDTNYTKEPL
jgi:hypothetical protein